MSVRLWKKPSIKQGSFEEIVATARQAFLSDNPNPERKGCPEPKLLMDLAWRKADRDTALRVTLHLRHCSDCFRDASGYLQRYNTRRAWRFKLLAAAAGIVLAALAALLIQKQFHEVNSVRQAVVEEPSKPLNPPKVALPPAEIQIGKVAAPLPVVNYFVASPTRGPGPPKVDPGTLVLQGTRLQLRIHLPLGSVSGEYEVRLHRKADKKEVLRAFRSAARDNQFILSIEEDFSRFPPGAYLLAIFPPGWKGDVEAHPVRIVSSERN